MKLPNFLRFWSKHFFQAEQGTHLGRNKSSARSVRPTYHRTALFAGITKDLGELANQIILDKGGPLLPILQDAALQIHVTLSSSRTAIPERLLEEVVRNNLNGGRRNDLPLTPGEARQIVFMTIGLSLDFSERPARFFEHFFKTFEEASPFLAPVSKEEALVLIEALQVVREYERAQLVISDSFGRYGFDGDREMMCLQSNNLLYLEREGKISPARADNLRKASIPEIFGTLTRVEWTEEISMAGLRTSSEVPPAVGKRPLISVILTVYNGGVTLPYAINSVLRQSWKDLELIVIDDGSTDETPAILAQFARRDSRIRLYRNELPTGAYRARNQALKHVTGEAVTCHDADDWSHPQKIERQALLLFENRKTVATTSSWIRATDELEFTRKSRHKRYVQRNPSSLMFKTTAIMRVGDWDEVTIGADTEFEERLKVVFGKTNVRHLNEVLAFGLDHSTSLSKDAVWRGWLSSDLDAYHRAFQHWHSVVASKRQRGVALTADRGTNGNRSFPAPSSYLKTSRPEYFDVVMISDFRLYGGSVLSCVEEIKAQHKAGLTTAIHQINCVSEDITGRTRFNHEVDKLINDGFCTLIGDDWNVNAGMCSIRFPPIFNYPPSGMPNINTAHHVFAVNTAPIEPSGDGRMYYIDRVMENIVSTFGHPIMWHPIGPRIRDYIAGSIPKGMISEADWVNILDVDDWTCERHSFNGDRPVVGRHSRDDKVKWPTDAQTLTDVYFSNPGWDVRFMGGATVPASLVGELPPNVTVLPFNGVPVKTFLRSLDFFVFYDDPERVEAFGRVFIEAIAAGCCVILPRYYESVFGEACLYASPAEVGTIVNELYADLPRYLRHVAKAQSIAREKWSYSTHEQRVRKILGSSDPA